MRKALLFPLLLLIINSSSAQGVYQMLGMTQAGGSDNWGTIFTIDTLGNQVQRYQFIKTFSGTTPYYMEPVLYNGKFYGTTYYNGIFEWDPATNIYTRKITMDSANGRFPLSGLTMSGGKFYGACLAGGANNLGVLYEWDPATNIYTKKFDFSGTDGSSMKGKLTEYAGKLYGMTSAGGINDKGVLFEWDPATNIYTKKIDLATAIGSNPAGNLELVNNKFYGMTYAGGINDKGVLFEWDPATNIYTKKIDLSVTNGRNPFGSLAYYNGKLYGATTGGGTNDVGVIFEWDQVNNIYTKKFNMNCSTGCTPYGRLSLSGSKFYGITTASNGNIFEWDPATNIYTKKVDFSYTSGATPMASLVLNAGKFYGTTTFGGSQAAGTMFEWDPATNVYIKRFDFNGDIGFNPSGKLTEYNGKYYGMTTVGGNGYGPGGGNGYGVIFSWDPGTKMYTSLVNLSIPLSGSPHGSLTMYNGKFYGMTSNTGPAPFYGGIFSWDPATNIYVKEYNFFTSSEAANPYSDLTMYNGKFYGMTQGGGANGKGTFFEWDPATKAFIKKIDFNGTNGAFPYGSVSLYAGKLYGMTSQGGAANGGVIFEWDPATNTYTKKIDMTAANGSVPYASFTLFNNKFYGTTAGGGANSNGTIFEWDPATNTYTRKISLLAATGSTPYGNLTLCGSKFFGMTSAGGANSKGVIFSWDPASNTYNKIIDLNGANGSTPLFGNDLVVATANISNGTAGTCTAAPALNISAANNNNNVWVPIMDGQGDVIAEINANGNDLGSITPSVYINNTGVREDWNNRLYLDRNIRINVQTQPLTPVDIRLYIKGSEYTALKNAVNSHGQSTGINSIDDMGIFKNNDNCLPNISNVPIQVPCTVANWGSNGYVLSGSINGFSSFYFANKTFTVLPLTLLEFKGKRISRDIALTWKTSNENNLQEYQIERSIDAANYTAITTVSATNLPGTQSYQFVDRNIISLNAPIVYYRLKQLDHDGHFTYSPVVSIQVSSNETEVALYPNPATDKTTLSIYCQSQLIDVKLVDNAGRILNHFQQNVPGGSTDFSIDTRQLPKGIYYLQVKGIDLNRQIKFLKN